MENSTDQQPIVTTPSVNLDGPAPTSPSPAPTPPTKKPASTKKLLLIGGAILGVLLIGVIILLVLVLNRPSSSDKSTTSDTSQSTDSTSSSTATKKKVLLTLDTSNDKLQLIIYKPTQTATNTTINFSVKNTCAGCSDSTYSGRVTSGFDSKSGSYLVDDTAGKKYNTITDEDDDVLATTTCGSYIKYNETADCFVSFSKVPSGTTVSWVFGSTRIDGIKVE